MSEESIVTVKNFEFLIASVHNKSGLNSKPFRSIYVKKAYNTIDSNSSIRWGLKPGGLLGAFEKSRL